MSRKIPFPTVADFEEYLRGLERYPVKTEEGESYYLLSNLHAAASKSRKTPKQRTAAYAAIKRIPADLMQQWIVAGAVMLEKGGRRRTSVPFFLYEVLPRYAAPDGDEAHVLLDALLKDVEIQQPPLQQRPKYAETHPHAYALLSYLLEPAAGKHEAVLLPDEKDLQMLDQCIRKGQLPQHFPDLNAYYRDLKPNGYFPIQEIMREMAPEGVLTMDYRGRVAHDWRGFSRIRCDLPVFTQMRWRVDNCNAFMDAAEWN